MESGEGQKWGPSLGDQTGGRDFSFEMSGLGEHLWLGHVCGSVLRSVAVQLGKEGKTVL